MAICVSCPAREASVSVEEWKTLMRIPVTCVLSPDEESEITRALLRADAEFARYAKFWPVATVVCEEHDLYFKSGRCRFDCGSDSGRLVLKYGKVQEIIEVEFLQRALRQAQGPAAASRQARRPLSAAERSTERSRRSPVEAVEAGDCWTESKGSLCVLDDEFGLVELAQWQSTDCVNYNLDRIRIRYTSGDCGYPDLLAPFAATFLPFPTLCGVDLRRDAWDRWTLTDTEHEVRDQTTEEEMSEGISRSGTTAANNWSQGTNRSTTTVEHEVTDNTKTKEYRREPDKRDWACPWGLQPAQLAMWRFLRGRRRMRAIRV